MLQPTQFDAVLGGQSINPYLIKAKAAAKAMEEKLELERQTILAQFESPAVEPYTESELRAIANTTDETFIDAEDYLQQWEIEVIMTTPTIPVIDSTSELNQHQFKNRYSIYCHDPFEYQPVSIELIEQLAKDLKADGAIIVDTVMSSGRQGRYLTADSFDTIQELINEKENDKDYLAEGYGAYLLDISSPLFYKGYPKLFWKDYQFNDRVDSKNEWGKVCYADPIPFERSLK